MRLLGANVALWRKDRPRVLDGKAIAKEVECRVTLDVLARSEGTRHLEEIVHETIYTEQIRLQDPNPGPSAANDRSFS